VCACGCALKRIGEGVAEKLDYTPGVFTVHRHIRGKWACAKCQTLIQAPVAAHVIDKGIPTTGLLAQGLVAKYLDHQPLYRKEGIFARAGLAIPRSTLAQWVGACGVQLQPLVDALRQAMLERGVLHADETPVAMLVPRNGKTHRAYVWTYGTTSYDSLKAVIYDFAQSRAGENARRFLEGWRGKLVCDDFAGYKALFRDGVTEVGCMAHARRKFHELWVNHKSPLAEESGHPQCDHVIRHGGRVNLIALGIGPVREPLHHHNAVLQEVAAEIGPPHFVAFDVRELTLDRIAIESAFVQQVGKQAAKAVRGYLETKAMQRQTQRVFSKKACLTTAREYKLIRLATGELLEFCQECHCLFGQRHGMVLSVLHPLGRHRPACANQVDLIPSG
jgi:transposase